MDARVFQFTNSYLSEHAAGQQVEYSALGYFDGFRTLLYEEKNQDYESAVSDPYYMMAQPEEESRFFKEQWECFNVLGFCREKDHDFWEAEEAPLIFITFIRLRNRARDMKRVITVIRQQTEGFRTAFYHTYDSSDLIVCLRMKNYAAGEDIVNRYPDAVREADSGNELRKSFTVCVIRQEILNDAAELERLVEPESVSLFLRCVIKHRDQVAGFERELKARFGCVRQYGLLGSDDMAFLIQNVDIRTFLKQYGSGCLLTHDHEQYNGAFYRITSEILAERSRQDGDGT